MAEPGVHADNGETKPGGDLTGPHVILNPLVVKAAMLTGELSCPKGMQGLKGVP